MLLCKVSILFSLLFTNGTPTTVENDWITDYDKAIQLAQAEGKHVLINFTGSDWCGWCKRLKSEVFSKSEFQEFAKEELVLLELDFPKYTQQSESLKEQNQTLARQYAVRGFPTILLLDKNEKLLLTTGYQRGGATNYVNHLKGSMN